MGNPKGLRYPWGNGPTAWSAATSSTQDAVAPTGSVTVNGGQEWTASLTVTLTLSAADACAGVAQMRFSNDGSAWSGWQSYTTSADWTLTSGDGLKTVYAQFQDAAGNPGAVTTDTISALSSRSSKSCSSLWPVV